MRTRRQCRGGGAVVQIVDPHIEAAASQIRGEVPAQIPKSDKAVTQIEFLTSLRARFSRHAYSTIPGPRRRPNPADALT